MSTLDIPERISIVREPLTYEARMVRDRTAPHGLRAISTREPRSYIQDFCLARANGDSAATERLQRHAREMADVGVNRDRLFDAEYRFDADLEERAVNWTAGLGGYFAPPLWLVEQFAIQPTPERVLSRLAPTFELPEGVQSVNIPAYTAGPEVADIGVGGAAAGYAAVVDTAVSSAVTTIAGNFDVPLQMLEQSPQGAHMDWIAFTSMEARYGYRLEQQLISGAGATVPQGSGNNQLLGILNNAAIPTGNIIANTASAAGIWFGATGTGAGPLAQAPAAIGNNRKLPPEIWMLTTSRAAWLGSAEVSMFPLSVTNQTGPGKFDILAYPVEHNNAIPTTVNSNQDIVIACRPSDWLILESEPRTSVMLDVLSGALMARLQMRRYVAAVLRQPTSVAYLTGSGNVIPTSF